MSQIVIVKDASNNKLRELESNASGELKVSASSLPLPSGAASEVSSAATASSTGALNSKVTACNTGAVVVSGSALPAGAATESSLSAVDSSTAALNLKVTACNTGAVVVSGSALPSGAATEVSAGACASSLATLAGAVSANVVQVSASSSAASATTVYSGVTIADGATTKSSSVDVNAYKSVCIFGRTSNLTESVDIEVSADNSAWYELNNHFISVDFTSGDFGANLDVSARYVRLSKKNSSGSSESITAIISAK